jgi:hypothetical protein
MRRTSISTLLAGTFALISATQASLTQALGQQACKPALAFKEVQFSEWQPPKMERKWKAVLSVDASRCATTSGRFGILFSRQKENGPEVIFEERFAWKPTAVEVSVDFWADEAVEGYWLNNIAPCPCAE